MAQLTKENPDWLPVEAIENELISSLDQKAWRLTLRQLLS